MEVEWTWVKIVEGFCDDGDETYESLRGK